MATVKTADDVLDMFISIATTPTATAAAAGASCNCCFCYYRKALMQCLLIFCFYHMRYTKLATRQFLSVH